jgi:hypothetical protein
MHKNRFPGICGCGKRVASKCGELSLQGDVFTVRCTACVSGNIQHLSKENATAAKPRKLRAGTRRPARRTGKVLKWRGKTRSRKQAQGAAWGFAPATPASVFFSPIIFGASVMVRGATLPCTPEYRDTEAQSRAASAAGNLSKDLELLVTLFEMRELGHLAA